MSDETFKITAVTPALPGWVSVYRDDDSGGKLYMQLAVWAVVEDEGGPRVVGMSIGDDILMPDDSSGNFMGWEYNPAAFEYETERRCVSPAGQGGGEQP